MNKLHKKIAMASSAMIFIATIITAMPTMAASNTTLNGVEISSNSRGYDIVLNTDTATKIEKTISSSDKIILDLKNTKVAKDASTVYKNADGIENVILKPSSNDLQIEINGKKAGNSNVKLNNEIPTPLTATDYNNTVFVNRPMNSYAPVAGFETEEAAGLTFVGLLKNIINSESLRNLLSSPNVGWFLCFALMIGFIFKTHQKTAKSQPQVSLKISNKTEDTENKLLKDALARKEGLIGEGLGKQRQTQIQPKPQVNLQRANYGLKAYNNQPTGVNTSSFKAKQPAPMPRTFAETNRTPVLNRPTRTATTATAQELKQDLKKNEVHIDNVKFLESMAKIYERSGRVDLANGLTSNIKKAKTIR